MTPVLTSLDWRTRAACRDVDPELFFPVAAPGTDAYARQAAEAMKACGTCPVSRPCEDFATATRQHGVWGGTTPEQRDAGRASLTRGAV